MPAPLVVGPYVPRSREMCSLGADWLKDLPIWMRQDPDVKGAVDTMAREYMRFQAAMDAITDGIWLQRDEAGLYLGIWELMLGLAVDPTGYTLEQRRARDIAFLRKLRVSATGLDFVAALADVIGPGYAYAEHDPGDITSPPENTLRIVVPWPSDDQRSSDVAQLVREIVPAHLAIQWVYQGQGFVVGSSQVGVDAL